MVFLLQYKLYPQQQDHLSLLHNLICFHLQLLLIHVLPILYIPGLTLLCLYMIWNHNIYIFVCKRYMYIYSYIFIFHFSSFFLFYCQNAPSPLAIFMIDFNLWLTPDFPIGTLVIFPNSVSEASGYFILSSAISFRLSVNSENLPSFLLILLPLFVLLLHLLFFLD